MALIKCHECGSEISSEATTCPKCGVTPKNATSVIKTIAGALLILVFGLYFFGGGVEKHAASEMNKIGAQVATDAVAQYQIAKREGDKMQICVQAGFVAAAYLQAKDEANYQTWKTTEKGDCKKAGLPT